MILTCPNCGTSFSVPDGAIPPEGRRVRCANCDHRWQAKPPQAQPTPRPKTRPPAFDKAAPPKVSDKAREEARALREAILAGGDKDALAPAAPTEGVENDPVAAIRQVMEDTSAKDAVLEDTSPKGREALTPPAPPSLADPDEDQQTFINDAAPKSADAAGVTHEPLGPTSDSDPNDKGPTATADETDFMAKLEAQVDDLDMDFDFDGPNEFSIDVGEPTTPRGRKRSFGELFSRAVKRLAQGLWVLLILGWLGLFGAFFFAGDMVRAQWPASTVILDMLASANDLDRFREDIDPNSKPLTDKEEIIVANITKFYFEDQDGRQTLVIEGEVLNQGDISANVPRIRGRLMNARGMTLQQWEFDPKGRILSRGGRIPFRQSVYPVPDNTVQVAVSVIEGSKSQNEAELQ